MFVTDTTDAAYPPEEYSPEALMDRLAEILIANAGGAPVSLSGSVTLSGSCPTNSLSPFPRSAPSRHASALHPAARSWQSTRPSRRLRSCNPSFRARASRPLKACTPTQVWTGTRSRKASSRRFSREKTMSNVRTVPDRLLYLLLLRLYI
jgi:hypothetical protein